MKRVVGAVDWLEEPHRFFGWARLEPYDASVDGFLTVEAHLDGRLVGSGVARDIVAGGNPAPIRFTVQISEVFDALDLIRGKLVFKAVGAGGISGVLSVYDKLEEQLAVLCCRKLMERSPPKRFAQLLGIFADEGIADHARRLKECLPFILKHNSDEKLPGVVSRELSMFGLTPGSLSPSGAIVVGLHGHFFIKGGSNGLLSQYQTLDSEAEVQRVADAWGRLVDLRSRELSKRGARYLQLIIPEKSSVVPESFPLEIKTPTPYFEMVHEVLSRSLAPDEVLNALQVMLPHTARTDFFRHHDSHLTPFGSYQLFREIMSQIGAGFDADCSFDNVRVLAGDLSSHFPGLPLAEYVRFPKPCFSAEMEKGLSQMERHLPSPGKHVGTRCVWTNESAPVRLRVVAFGNSFFEKGGSSVSLSWWACRFFREFHFVWSPDIDFAYVDRTLPDVVIHQTIERFLPTVPSS